MLRNGDALFGVGLALLWMAGLATHATQWLTWLNGLGAFCAGYLALYGQNGTGGPVGTIALGLVLLLASIVGVLQHSTVWLAWSTMGVACFFIFIGALSALTRYDSRVPPHIVRPMR